MSRLMDLDGIRTVIEQAISVSVQAVQVPGIADAELRSASLSSKRLQRVAAQIEQHGQSALRLSAEVETLCTLRSEQAPLPPKIKLGGFAPHVFRCRSSYR